MFQELDLDAARLNKVFGMGCLVIKGAHLWPLTHAVWESSPKEVSATFFCEELDQWDGVSLLRIEIFELHKAKSDFKDRLEWYTRDRKTQRIEVAGGGLFDESMLQVKGFSKDWEQDAFAISKCEIIRIYRSKRHAVIFRFLSRAGSLFDHPIFKRAIKNIRFDGNAWQTQPPGITDTRPKSERVVETPLRPDQYREIEELAGATGKELDLARVKKSTTRLKRIEEELDAIRARKKRGRKEFMEHAIELGCLVGEVFRAEFDWEWCNLKAPDGSLSVAVCSPDRAVYLAPAAWVLDLLSNRHKPINCVLTFNLIGEGVLPSSRPGGYTQLG